MPNNPPSPMRLRTNLLAGKITIYGQEWCSWTQKQKTYLQEKSIPFTYVDCAKQTCPSFVTSFPTLDVDGKITPGYQEI